MGFLMDGLDAEAYDRSYGDTELLRRVLRYFRPEGARMVGISVAVLASSVAETALPIYVARTLDELARGGQRPLLAAAVILLLGALAWALNYARRALTAQAVGNVVLELRKDAFDAVLARDLSFYDQFSSGKIVSRVNS